MTFSRARRWRLSALIKVSTSSRDDKLTTRRRGKVAERVGPPPLALAAAGLFFQSGSGLSEGRADYSGAAASFPRSSRPGAFGGAAGLTRGGLAARLAGRGSGGGGFLSHR